MAKYFSKFPKTFYSLENTPYSFDVVTNIISRYSFEQSFKDNTSIFEKYNFQESDTPEIIASKIYDSPERHWIVLMMNDIVDAQYDLPLEYRTLTAFIDDKYTANANTAAGQTGLMWSQENTHSYYSVEKRTTIKTGDFSENKIHVDANTYANLVTSSTNKILSDGSEIKIDKSKESKSYYDYEIDENESKRQIKILKPEFAYALEQELKTVFTT